MAMNSTVSTDINTAVFHMVQAKNMGIAMLACVGLVFILPWFGGCVGGSKIESEELISEEPLIDMCEENETINDSRYLDEAEEEIIKHKQNVF